MISSNKYEKNQNVNVLIHIINNTTVLAKLCLIREINSPYFSVGIGSDCPENRNNSRFPTKDKNIILFIACQVIIASCLRIL